MIKSTLRSFLGLFLIQLLVACGGGGEVCDFAGGCTGGDTDGGGSDDGGTVTPGSPISLFMIRESTGLATSTVSSAEPARLVATITGVSEPVIVTFTATKGTVSEGGSALASGAPATATVDLTIDGQTGAGQATASVRIDGVVYTDTISYQVEASATSIELKLYSSVTGLETTSISATNTGRLVATVGGLTETVIVNFSTTKGTVSNSGAALTDGSGEATVDLFPGDATGAGIVTASVQVGSLTLSDTVVFQISAAEVGAEGKYLQFVSAEPETIVLRGSGGASGSSETSIVQFKVLDADGNPVSGEDVHFALNTTTGGIGIDPIVATSDGSGLVRTVVSSGTVTTSVRVTATLKDDSDNVIYSVQSSRLVISTGLPDQDSTSLSATILNIEGGDIDGTTTTLTIRMADGFNNPVPDGTAVSFSTEGGSVQPFCLTTGGACSVTWTSQDPRPLGGRVLSDYVVSYQEHTMLPPQPWGGRVTVTATAIGEESFNDTNGNGRFDESEMAAFLALGVDGRSFDLGEAFADYNEDGLYNPAFDSSEPGWMDGGDLETLVDFNSNGIWDEPDGLYNGSLCSEPGHAGCSTIKTINVRDNITLIMSGSEPVFSLTNYNGSVAKVCYSDINNNPLPSGTTIKIEYDGSLGANDDDSFTLTNSNMIGPRCINRLVTGEGFGTAKFEVTVPSGLKTTATVFIQKLPVAELTKIDATTAELCVSNNGTALEDGTGIFATYGGVLSGNADLAKTWSTADPDPDPEPDPDSDPYCVSLTSSGPGEGTASVIVYPPFGAPSVLDVSYTN